MRHPQLDTLNTLVPPPASPTAAGTDFQSVEAGAVALLAEWMGGTHTGRLLPKDARVCFDPWRERE